MTVDRPSSGGTPPQKHRGGDSDEPHAQPNSEQPAGDSPEIVSGVAALPDNEPDVVKHSRDSDDALTFDDTSRRP